MILRYEKVRAARRTDGSKLARKQKKPGPPLTWRATMTKLLKKENLPDWTTLTSMSWRREPSRVDRPS